MLLIDKHNTLKFQGFNVYQLRDAREVPQGTSFFCGAPGTPTGAEMGRTLLEVKVLSAPDTLAGTGRGKQ